MNTHSVPSKDNDSVIDIENHDNDHYQHQHQQHQQTETLKKEQTPLKSILNHTQVPSTSFSSSPSLSPKLPSITDVIPLTPEATSPTTPSVPVLRQS